MLNSLLSTHEICRIHLCYVGKTINNHFMTILAQHLPLKVRLIVEFRIC